MNLDVRVMGALSALTLSSCGGPDGSEAPTFSVVDSLGIEIVTSHAPAWSPDEVWRVARDPARRIGELEGSAEYTFGEIPSAGWLSDGRIFVGDSQAHTIRLFSPEGEFLEAMGGEGRGPGELQWFLTVAPYRGDSLFVYDYRQSVVSVFTPEATFARRFQNPVTQGNYWIVAALRSGEFLLFSPGDNRQQDGSGLVPDTSFVIVSSADGTSVDTVGTFEARVRFLGADGRSEPLYLYPIGTLVGGRDRLLWLEGKTFEYTEADPDGTVRRIVRKSQDPVPVTEDVIGAFKRHYLERLGPDVEGGRDRLRHSLEEGEYYPHLPAMSIDVEVDALGYVWVPRYHFPGEIAEEWEVFDSAGVWQGTVQTPKGLDVQQIGVDRVLGVVTDDLDVPYVQIHDLDRR